MIGSTPREDRDRRWALENVPTAKSVDYVLDQVHYVTALFAKRYFRNDPLTEFPFVDTRELILGLQPRVAQTGKLEWSITIEAEGTQRTAKIHWRDEPRPGKPLLIYHHGAGSIPYDQSFNRILPPGSLEAWNVGCIQAACHDSLRGYFKNAFDRLLHMQLLFGASVHAFQFASRRAVELGSPFTAFCGVSIGGLVSSLHMMLYSSADLYLPMLAGLDMHHTFMRASTRPLTDQPEKRAKLACYRSALDFSPWLTNAPKRPCFPLLAEHDRLMDTKRAQRTWKGYTVKTIPRGHASGVMAYKALAEHVLTHLPNY